MNQAKTEAIAAADAELNNADLPTYSELRDALLTIKANAASVQMDPQWSVWVAARALARAGGAA